MFKVKVPAGSYVIRQGEPGDNFYAVASGSFQFTVARSPGAEPTLVGTAEAGATFGELALLYGSPRAASVLATEDSVLWALDRDTFQMMLTTQENTKKRTYEDFLENIEILRDLNKYERVQLCDMFVSSRYRPGECIIKQGDLGERFYVLEKGRGVAVIEDAENQRELIVCHYEPGSYFGELALLGKGVRKASVFAVGACTVLSIDKPTFDRVLGPIHSAFSHNLKTYRQAVEKTTSEWDRRRELRTGAARYSTRGSLSTLGAGADASSAAPTGAGLAYPGGAGPDSSRDDGSLSCFTGDALDDDQQLATAATGAPPQEQLGTTATA